MRRPGASFTTLLVATVVVALLMGAVVVIVQPWQYRSSAPVVQPNDLTITDADRRAAQAALRPPHAEQFYFVMTDRFANGDPTNDTGGRSGDRTVTGFDPTNKGFYHGGDLRGLMDKLDYIQGLGTTAIWLTPAFVNMPVSSDKTSAGYHGYWITDFTKIDPHLGTNAEMKELIDKVHARGMRLFFDIITNHTADVNRYADSVTNQYISKTERPYQDKAGHVFDDAALAASHQPFPEIDAATAFPHQVVVTDPNAKTPAWLNDPRVYHNRGDSTWAGESNTYGDFYGLDDLWTERPEVVDGMTNIYQAWVDLGIDGFRIDTVKHVNIEFWMQFSPRILDHARAGGKADFFIFGEVYNPDPWFISEYTTTGRLPAALDFGFQAAVAKLVTAGPTSVLAQLYDQDDLYTDADSNASMLPTFVSNHDMGRIGMFVSALGSPQENLDRAKLAHSLMFLTRGQPVVYYGDEQGFQGLGDDQDARQDMFATQTPAFATQSILGDTPGAKDRYHPHHPLYRHIASLAQLRKDHPGLATGAQIMRFSSGSPGILALSRIDSLNQEYVVVANTASSARMETFKVGVPGAHYVNIYGGGQELVADSEGRIRVKQDALSLGVWKAATPVPACAHGGPKLSLAPVDASRPNQRVEIRAELAEPCVVTVTFLARKAGQAEFHPLGTDDNPVYRVLPDWSQVPVGTTMEIRALAKDAGGNLAVATTSVKIGG